MLVRTSVVHDIKYVVASFEKDSEYSYKEFGKVTGEISIALDNLRLAEINEPDRDWQVVLVINSNYNSVKEGQ